MQDGMDVMKTETPVTESCADLASRRDKAQKERAPIARPNPSPLSRIH